MTIDDAIDFLQTYKAAGTKSIMLITMTADNFGMADDEVWESLAALGESDLRVLDSVTEGIENIKEEEGYVGEDDEEDDDDFIDEEDE